MSIGCSLWSNGEKESYLGSKVEWRVTYQTHTITDAEIIGLKTRETPNYVTNAFNAIGP